MLKFYILTMLVEGTSRVFGVTAEKYFTASEAICKYIEANYSKNYEFGTIALIVKTPQTVEVTELSETIKEV
jgi:hypothetical protein